MFLHTTIRCIFISKDMKFDEMKFPLDITITKPSCTFKVATNSNFKNLLPMLNHRSDNVNVYLTCENKSLLVIVINPTLHPHLNNQGIFLKSPSNY
jgi:hypothetical protein